MKIYLLLVIALFQTHLVFVKQAEAYVGHRLFSKAKDLRNPTPEERKGLIQAIGMVRKAGVFAGDLALYYRIMEVYSKDKIKIANRWEKSAGATSSEATRDGKIILSAELLPNADEIWARVNPRKLPVDDRKKRAFDATYFSALVQTASSLVHEATHLRQSWMQKTWFFTDSSELAALQAEDSFLYEYSAAERSLTSEQQFEMDSLKRLLSSYMDDLQSSDE